MAARPDLLHSLDALTEYVFPKVRAEFGTRDSGSLREAVVDAAFGWNPFRFKRRLAEACAEAILSLIGEE
ncbi:hypothetical protein LCGC14_1572710 [marine sediment metagenome]|uniref:Uncharacterized protein n=1 Tax=marine sediment metagenome TaxID=412755 RepID=A0A0F9LJP8_9ZZZZ